jgi:hypothetical protein
MKTFFYRISPISLFIILFCSSFLHSPNLKNPIIFVSSFIILYTFPGYVALRTLSLDKGLDFTQKWVFSTGLSLAMFAPIALIGYLFRLRIETLNYALIFLTAAGLIYLFFKDKQYNELIIRDKNNLYVYCLYCIALIIAYAIYLVGPHQDWRPIFWDWIHHVGAMRIITDRPALSPYEWYLNLKIIEPTYGLNVLYVLVGSIAKFLKVDIIDAYVGLHPILSFISIFVFYVFMLEITEHKALSILSTIVYVIYQALYMGLLPWRIALHAGGGFTILILIPLALIFFIRAIKTNSRGYYFASALAACALACYHVFAVVIFLFMILGYLLAEYLFVEDRSRSKNFILVLLFAALFGIQDNIVSFLLDDRGISQMLRFFALNINSLALCAILALVFVKKQDFTLSDNKLEFTKKAGIVILPVVLFTAFFTFIRIWHQDLGLARHLSPIVSVVWGPFYILIPSIKEFLYQIMYFSSALLLLTRRKDALFLFLVTFIPVLFVYNPVLCTLLGQMTSSLLVRRICYELPLVAAFSYAIYFFLIEPIKNRPNKLVAASASLVLFAAVPFFFQTHEIINDAHGIPMISTSFKDVIKTRVENGPLIVREPVWDFMAKNVKPWTVVLSDYFTSTLLPVYVDNYVVTAYSLSCSRSEMAKRMEDTKTILDPQTPEIDTIELLDKYKVSYILINSSFTLLESADKFDKFGDLFSRVYSDNKYFLYYFDSSKARAFIKSFIFENKLSDRVSRGNAQQAKTFDGKQWLFPIQLQLKSDPFSKQELISIPQNNGIDVSDTVFLSQPFTAETDNISDAQIFVAPDWGASGGVLNVELRKDENGLPANNYLAENRVVAPKMPPDHYVSIVLNARLEKGKRYHIVVYSANSKGGIGTSKDKAMSHGLEAALLSRDSGRTWEKSDFILSFRLNYSTKYFTVGSFYVPLIYLEPHMGKVYAQLNVENGSKESVELWACVSKDIKHWRAWQPLWPNVDSMEFDKGSKYLRFLVILRSDNGASTPNVKSLEYRMSSLDKKDAKMVE